MLAERERTRLAVEVREGRSFANPVTGERSSSVATNAASVEARLTALRAAHAAAVALRVEPLGEAEVIARLTALHAAIPEVEPLALAGHFSPGELRTIAWHAEDAGRSDDDAPSKLSGTLGAGRIRGCAGT